MVTNHSFTFIFWRLTIYYAFACFSVHTLVASPFNKRFLSCSKKSSTPLSLLRLNLLFFIFNVLNLDSFTRPLNHYPINITTALAKQRPYTVSNVWVSLPVHVHSSGLLPQGPFCGQEECFSRVYTRIHQLCCLYRIINQLVFHLIWNFFCPRYRTSDPGLFEVIGLVQKRNDGFGLSFEGIDTCSYFCFPQFTKPCQPGGAGEFSQTVYSGHDVERCQQSSR